MRYQGVVTDYRNLVPIVDGVIAAIAIYGVADSKKCAAVGPMYFPSVALRCFNSLAIGIPSFPIRKKASGDKIGKFRLPSGAWRCGTHPEGRGLVE